MFPLRLTCPLWNLPFVLTICGLATSLSGLLLCLVCIGPSVLRTVLVALWACLSGDEHIVVIAPSPGLVVTHVFAVRVTCTLWLDRRNLGSCLHNRRLGPHIPLRWMKRTAAAGTRGSFVGSATLAPYRFIPIGWLVTLCLWWCPFDEYCFVLV